MLQAIFPGHPYSLPPRGREEVLAKLGAEQLSEWHSRLIKRQLPLVVIVGDTSGSALVSGQLAEGFRRRDLDKTLPAKVAQAGKPGDRSEQRLREHTMLSLGYPGPAVEGNDLPTIHLLNAAVVEDQNLGPAIAFGHDALFTSSVAYIQMPVAPDDEQRARAALASELERMSRSGLSANEMTSARFSAIALYTHRLQTHKARALAYARAVLYLRPAGEVDSLIEQMAKLTPEDVKRVAAKYFKPSAAFAGIVRGKAAQQPQTTSR
jgi:predicted Zn-dependent peptidase